MAKNKNSSKKSGKDHYESGKMLACLIIVLTILVAGLTGGLIYAVAHMKTAEDKEYLAVYEHLMQRYPELRCTMEDALYDPDSELGDTVYAGMKRDKSIQEAHTCVMTDYGVSKDGDPYVSYIRYSYNPETHEQKGEGEKLTLYFQHSDDHYAEALGHD